MILKEQIQTSKLVCPILCQYYGKNEGKNSDRKNVN